MIEGCGCWSECMKEKTLDTISLKKRKKRFFDIVIFTFQHPLPFLKGLKV